MRKTLKFIDLFSGLGGFHLALKHLGHKCIFASEINKELSYIYEKNFKLKPKGDIRSIHVEEIPRHDILCAGFPCQPFSKAGEQRGTKCKLWGDLFSKHVLRVIKYHRPKFFIMENVANLKSHNGGTTWNNMKRSLEKEGYEVDAKILSPHRFKIPQIRERLFIVGSRSRSGLNKFNWPAENESQKLSIHSILTKNPKNARLLPKEVKECLNVWQEFIKLAPKDEELPSFPIWTMEFGANYPYESYDSLHEVPLKTLKKCKGRFGKRLNKLYYREEILKEVPSYAQGNNKVFPHWKQDFIRKNRSYYLRNKKWIKPWLLKIKKYPASFQKFEWNCKGEERDINSYILQFRASGVRVKRPTTSPSLVAMTTTQVPIIPWENRYMTPYECSRLQSMESLKYLPDSLTTSHKALGNAVNVNLVSKIAKNLISSYWNL